MSSISSTLYKTGILATAILSTYIFGHLTPTNDKNEEKEFDSIDNEYHVQLQSLKNSISNQFFSQIKFHPINNTSENRNIKNIEIYSFLDTIEDPKSLMFSKNALYLANKVSKCGFPSLDNLRFYDSYLSSINYQTRIPNWVAEYLTLNEISSKLDSNGNEIKIERKKHFMNDSSVPEMFQATKNDYRSSFYSRGHLAPAGAHNNCQLNKDLTFILSSNIVPQELSMNGSDWLRLERFITKELLIRQRYENVLVFTGPLFMPDIQSRPKKYSGEQTFSVPKFIQENEEEYETIEIMNEYQMPLENGRLQSRMNYKVIGPTQVHVPTHMWKVILAQKPKNREIIFDENEFEPEFQMAAFLIANECSGQQIPLREFLCSVEDIERYTGLQFFSQFNIIENIGSSNVENVEELIVGDLCKYCGCFYVDDERSVIWRALGMIKNARTLEDLEYEYHQALDVHARNESEKDWIPNLYARGYRYRKRCLSSKYQKEIDSVYEQYYHISKH